MGTREHAGPAGSHVSQLDAVISLLFGITRLFLDVGLLLDRLVCKLKFGRLRRQDITPVLS
jgi:hypothetical protein